MKKLLILLLITNMTIASNLKNIETDEKLNESLALSQHFKEFTNQQKGISFFTVGADGACGYSSIQAAIDDFFQSPLSTIEIRIATNKTYFENIVIGNANITLTGGYANCFTANAGNGTNNQVTIDADNSGVVLKIQGVTTRRTMVFSNLNLINGNNPTGAGGGLLSDNSKVSLLLENVDIRNNTASHGAGIAIVGGDTDLLMNESLIFGNVADYGGGIYCSGGASSVNVANHSGIIANIANGTNAAPEGRGGGAYISSCYFAIFTGSPNNGSFTGMSSNSSEVHGGAVYAENAIIRFHGHQSCGSLGCLGDNTNPVSFRGNQSVGTGPVLYAYNTDVRINATWMDGNIGFSMIYLDRSGLLLERFQQPCWNNSQCNLIENNAVSNIIAGYYINDTSISNAVFQNNVGRAFSFNTPGQVSRSLKIESNIFSNNDLASRPYMFSISGAIDMTLIHNTIIDNHPTVAIFNLDFQPASGIPPIFEAHSNIIDNPGVALLAHSAISSNSGIDTVDVNISALITNETDSISESSGVFNDAINFAGGDFITETIPGEVLFVDRANGNLHLSPNSRAIDYFNTPSRVTVTYKDIDYEDRGFDDPNNASPFSGLFYYDIGADESYSSDVIFKNGFE